MESLSLMEGSAGSVADPGTPRLMHRMLAVHDVLIHIFYYSEQEDLVVAARVSRAWSDVALDYLWREMKSVFPLVEILYPLVETDGGEWSFTGRTSRQNWERFQRYTRRIRRLEHYDLSSKQPKSRARSRLLAELPTLVASELPENEPLLPNIQAIEWVVTFDIANLPCALPFIQPSLKTFIVDVRASGSDDPVHQFLDRLTAFPELDLESFTFFRPSAEVTVVERLLSFLKRQANLKTFVLSCDPYVEQRMVQSVLFPNLPTGLRTLDGDVEFYEKSDYTDLIQTILQRLPDLRALKLTLTSLGSWRLSDFEGLSPVLQNPNLEELRLCVSGEIRLDPGDIQALGKALPKLTRLDLCLHYWGSPAVKIQAISLMDFAKAFPNLQALKVHIQNIDTLPSHHSRGESAEVSAPNLSKLRVFDVGSSPLLKKDVPRMAEFLGILGFHPHCVIEYERGGKANADAAPLWRDVEATARLLQRPDSAGGKIAPALDPISLGE